MSQHYTRPLPVAPTAGPSSPPLQFAAQSNNGPILPNDGLSAEPIACNACKLGLEETLDNTVVSFGNYLFHVDCRCAKCHNLVEHDTNLLLLSDGSPVCENCSYICSVCQNPIHNEAIVTGDESYHAECFRCRSCSNKIEELVFAKTTQGIWCMSCHNERVARTRKHAEARRSRTDRKQKEANQDLKSRSTRDRNEKSLGRGDKEATSQSSTSRPLPPSPVKQTWQMTSDAEANDLTDSRRPSHQSEFSAREQNSHQRSASGSLAAVNDRIESNRTPSPNGRTRNDSTASQLLAESSDLNRSNSPGNVSRRPPLSHQNSSSDNIHSPNLIDSHPKSPSLSAVETSSRSGSLSAPVPNDKASNRRSGFYGSFSQRPSVDENMINNSVVPEEIEPEMEETKFEGEEFPSEIVDDEMEPSEKMTKFDSNSDNFLPELHNSLSFYDPDTLLFLNHVGTSPTSPNGPAANQASLAHYSSDIVNAQSDQIEHLNPEEYTVDGDANVLPAAREPKSEVARKVRESIQSSRKSLAEGGKSRELDVELVELVLAELDATKQEMKSLQSKYSAFRRASRTAFEGFSMARDEYDKEVAARRETEAQMELLRTKFHQQALKLAAADKEHKNQEELKRQSKELRSSVVATEKHLSVLRAEVILTTAQAAELAALDGNSTGQTNQTDTNTNNDALVEALNARLEKVKETHRQEIEILVSERDSLQKEVENLRATKILFTEETSALNLRNTALTDKNAAASKQLDNLRESVAKMKIIGGAGAVKSSLNVNGASSAAGKHQYSQSSSSLLPGLPSGTTRSPLSSNRSIGGTVSPVPAEFDHLHRLAKPEAAEPASVKKFKWGKSTKTTATGAAAETGHRPSISSVATTHTSSQSATLKPGTQPRAGSVDSGNSRSHSFQQTSILRPVRCDYCGDKMWGLNEVRCAQCGSYAHTKCYNYLQAACSGASGAPPPAEDTMILTSGAAVMFGNDLTAQVKAEDRQIPIVVIKCIQAVEAYGMTYEGIYRKTGGMSQTKLITQFFESRQDFDLLDLDKFNDLAAITSCLKNFFRSLPNPLFTHDLHEDFVSCAEIGEMEAKLEKLEQVLFKLPETHFYTARYLIRHLHR